MLYGGEVRGVTDHELLHLRRSAAITIKPSAGQRSLTVLSHLEGGPAWIGSVAPILRWHKEVWCAQVRAFEGSLSFRELRLVWEGVFL
eukprot:2214394-Pyramimonas_sp.AAC.1